MAFNLDSSLMAMKDAAHESDLAKLQKASEDDRKHWEQKVSDVQRHLDSNFKKVTEQVEKLSSELILIENEIQNANDEVNSLMAENMRLKREIEALKALGETEPGMKSKLSGNLLQDHKIENPRVDSLKDRICFWRKK